MQGFQNGDFLSINHNLSKLPFILDETYISSVSTNEVHVSNIKKYLLLF